MKVVEKQRIGRKVKKKYQITTPLNRILELNDVKEKREMLNRNIILNRVNFEEIRTPEFLKRYENPCQIRD
ncbi:hypothetical protein J7K25_07275 [bacterium]|nr:hypothetical protein [bacterium]